MQPARQLYTILIFISALLWFGRLAVAGEEFWSLSQPHTQGVNEAILQRLHQEFQDGSHGYIDSFLVIKNGQLVFEEYYENDYHYLTTGRKETQAETMRSNYGDLARPQYNYYDPDWHPYYRHTHLHTIQSVSKSVTSALIGIAIGRGEIPHVDIKIVDYFPEYKSLFSDWRKQSITLRHLLTMTAGIKWDEFSFKYTDPLNNAASMESSNHWIEYVLSQPMEREPGETFAYNSGITMLLSHVLYQATGMHAEEYAKNYLFEPLGIKEFYWKKTPIGLTDAEGGLYLSSRDFAKIGYLYLKKGAWDNEQILNEEWVKSTMLPHTSILGSKRRYGYQWWLVPYAGGRDQWAYSGSGYGGQYLIVLPEYAMILVFTGWNIFDVTRPTIEYLISRVLKSVQ